MSHRKDGPAAIIPGNPKTSELIRRITSSDPDEMMPPPGANKRPLSQDEREALAAWIQQGATYEPHWAFVPPVRPPIPEVKSPTWCRNDIDRFVLANLERSGVKPSDEAGKATLLRRVFLDLTGLPPTPEEIDAFLADSGTDAYERIVDRLLTEEPYRSRTAERLTAPWLDAARYADTCGIHTDGGRQMWLWRDWVLAAFRDNMPYDKFITEQLAGDLIPGASLQQKVASGFNRNHVTSDEGGAIEEELLLEYAVDRVSTTSGVFLGLTMGCARCHDHKYDPITQTDFYGMLAFFNSIKEPGLYSQTNDSKRAYEPFLDVPSDEQSQIIDRLGKETADLVERMKLPLEGEVEGRAEFVSSSKSAAGISWITPEVLTAKSTDESVKLTPGPDQSVQASGPMPDVEDYIITLKGGQAQQRLLLLEALSTPDAGVGAGRASHKNAVVTGVKLETRAGGASPSEEAWLEVPMRWAWADLAQRDDGDFQPTNTLDSSDGNGWAFDGHKKAGSRLLLLLSEKPFAESPTSELRVTVQFRSKYTQHSLGRVRFRTGALNAKGLAELPLSLGRWYSIGPIPTQDKDETFDKLYGPEGITKLDLKQTFGDDKQMWKLDARYVDAKPVSLAEGINTHYMARTIWSPDDREVEVSLGSDDAFRLYVNGVQVASNRIDRGVQPDQDKAKLPLHAGTNTIVFRICNTGGPAGFYFRSIGGDDVLPDDLVPAIFPADALSEEQTTKFETSYRRTRSPQFRELEKQKTELDKRLGAVRAMVPRTMVMSELEKPKETFVLTRGVYDKPDKSRPVSRAVPAALGKLPADAPQNRLGLAQWMTSPENPLAARVAVNRFWEMIFGAGLVRSSENFGLQGDWPTHAELLDWLAVDFREHGWDVRRLLKSIVLSSTYRQSSRVREDLRERDADNRLLAFYPRHRLTAEQIRDQALFVSGLLAERSGGPSVKPYQPDGLWQETAMPVSNTREYVRGKGEELWRRTIYNYWKRASPPPALLMLDAPTRESCVIRRPITNTPLQALVLWNDEQYVEAARALAQRTLAREGDDAWRLTDMFRRCTGRSPDEKDLAALTVALTGYRNRFAAAEEDAKKLIKIGEAPLLVDVPAPELASWTMVASAVLNLHESLTQD